MARISKLITKPLKEKIEKEALSLNLLKIKQSENLNILGDPAAEAADAVAEIIK